MSLSPKRKSAHSLRLLPLLTVASGLFFGPTALAAAPTAPDCWRQEGFASREAHSRQVSQWASEAVPFPGPLDAYAAYRIGKDERDFALDRLKNDKKAHCYMGCRIAQDVNFQTAQWAGWKKEDKDLRDCNPATHFEVMDYQVTVIGAHLGLSASSVDDCLRRCDRDFPGR